MTGAGAGQPPGRGRSPLPFPLGASAASEPTRFGPPPPLDGQVLSRLKGVCAQVSTSRHDLAEAGRDWWPLSAHWAARGQLPSLPAVVARPASLEELSGLLEVAQADNVAVTPFAGASGVCGGAIPLAGGLSLDMTGLAGLVDIDERSLLVRVRAGTFGPELEAALAAEGLSLGHWPQSFYLSTVGGWAACRGAGQYSTRYGKIEDMATSLEVVLAGGQVLRVGSRAPRAAVGPELKALFLGSEGTLGVISELELVVHPLPEAERVEAWAFPSFEAGLDACRRVLRRGATPAVVRLYDPTESERHFGVAQGAVLVVVDEGDPKVVDASMAIVAAECSQAEPLGQEPARRWLEHRLEVPDLESLVRAGVVADTVEVACAWGELAELYRRALERLRAIPGMLVASAHQSHSYPSGACLYFTFAGRPKGPDSDGAEELYRRAFFSVTSCAAELGGAISHHHGVGLVRSAAMEQAQGAQMELLRSIKAALDPHGILNPGKLGLAGMLAASAPVWPDAPADRAGPHREGPAT